MAGELAAVGMRPLVAPLLTAQPTQDVFPAKGYDHVIFVSEHAVIHANAVFEPLKGGLVGIAPEARWYAIGPATDAALAAAFAQTTAQAPETVVPEPARSEGLLDSKYLQHVAGDEVLIVAGVAGRSLLADTLQARGATVRSWLVYRRVEQLPTLASWPNADAVDALVASSGQGLELLTRQWLASAGAPSSRSRSGGLEVPVCVPSPRVFELATKLGWLKPVNCPGASAQATIAGLSQQGLWPPHSGF